MLVNEKERFECEANAKQNLHRRSAFFRAHLRGFMSTTFDRPFDVSEVQCLTEGDDVYPFRVAVSEATFPRLPARMPDRSL